MVLRSGKERKPLKTVGRRKKLKPAWVDLPRDITADILKRLDVSDLLESAQYVCTTWRSVCMEPSMFRKIHLRLSTDNRLNYQTQAIDRSQGQLQDLTISPNGDASFLAYVARRSPEIRCLTLSECKVTGEDVVEAVKKFPLLEELCLFHIPVAAELIEEIGSCCPLLKSFTYHKQKPIFWEWDVVCDMEALAIAKTMPGLRHLCVIENQMSNEGLVAILNACVNLESLDLRLCNNVDLRGDLGERCCRQIRDLKKPNDAIEVWPDFPDFPGPVWDIPHDPPEFCFAHYFNTSGWCGMCRGNTNWTSRMGCF